MTSCACLILSELNDISGLYVQSCILNRFLLGVKDEPFTQFAILHKEGSPAKNLTSEFSSCGKSLM